jgi:hypothetical protein
MRATKLFLTAVFIMSAFGAQSQMQLGLGGFYTKPINEFENSNYRDGGGMQFYLLSPQLLNKQSPVNLRLGAYFDVVGAGKNKFEVETYDPVGEMADVKFKNSSYSSLWMLRLEKSFSRWTVFADGLYGMRNFKGVKQISLQENSDLYEDDIDVLVESKRVRYGFAAGFIYQLSKTVGVEFKTQYTFGNGITYVDMESFDQDLNQICYKYDESKDSDLWFVGASFNFNLGNLFKKSGRSSGGSGSSTSRSSSNNTTKTTKTTKTKTQKKKVKVKTNPDKKDVPKQ